MDLSGIYDEQLRDVLRAVEERILNHLLDNPILAVGTDTTTFAVGDFSYKLAGVTYNKAADDDIASPATSVAGEFRKDLITIDAAGAVALVAGTAAASQAAAVAPATPASKLAVGVIEVPESFTGGTSNVTTGMLKDFAETVDVVYGNA